ncbi:hypothetical protein ACLKA6_012792 [Drosophila palustris]
MRRWAIQGETQAMQTRIRLADGSTWEVGRLLRVDVGMAGKVVNMPMLIMSSLMDHTLLGMDFLCAMGATVRCGDAELVLGTVGATAAEPAGPTERAGEPPRGVPSGGEKGPTRRGRRRRDGRTPGSSRRPSPGRGGTTEESRTQAAQPNSGLAATMAENEAAASVGVQAEGGEAAPRETSPRGVSRPRLAGSGSPSARVMVEDMEDGEGESPDEEAEWPEDLEPELKGFLEAKLALFEGLQGVSHIAEHKIRLKDDKPLKQRYYPKNPAMQRVLIQAGAIEPSRSPHSAPIVLVKKKTGDWRMCIDYRQLNAHSIPDAYPVPRINHILERLRHARFISTLDLKQGYWQIPMAADSRECTAFTVPGRVLFQWRVMPFGLHSACATLQRALDTVIGPEMEPHAFAYLDDIVVIGATKEQHVENLREKTVGVPRHVISGEGICTDPEKVEAIRSLRAPAICKELRQCLGMASWYRRFVPNFATLVRPMTELLKKGRKWSWDKEQEEALSQLKEKLTTAPVLACPDFSARFVLQTDASDYGLGAVLTQTVDGQERVIADEEMPEPPPEAYVEDCESSEAGEEGADTDTTEPRPEPRSDHADRDPRRRRPHYGEHRREAPPWQYRHTLYRGTVNTVDSYDGLVVCMSLKYRTLYIEAPHARNPPSYVEEPVSPIIPRAARRRRAIRAGGLARGTRGSLARRGLASRVAGAPDFLTSQEHDGRRRTVALDRGSPVFQGAPPTHPETPSGSPGTLGSLQENRGRRVVSGERRRDPRLWQLSSHGELEVDPTSTFPRVSIRFKPGVVTNPRLAGAEDAVPGKPPSLPRKRHGSRGRARGAPTENAVPTASAGRIAADEADQPATKPGPVREAKEEPPGTSLPAEPTEPREAATVSPTESELLREMEDLLDGWEPELDELLGEVGATLEPLIPRGWRVFPRGTILTAPTIQLLQGEVSRLGGEYRRSRFRVVDGEALYTVTINAAGTVTITLGEKGGV